MLQTTKYCRRYLSNLARDIPKICIIGAGPAGFYAAQHFVKRMEKVEVDIYEKLPVPFGLVRFGVAPDHPEVKNVIHTFTKTAEHPNVNFYGNISLGTDLTLKDLQKAYHIVLLSYGADLNKTLGIAGEDLENSLPARDIVGWYNGLPWNTDLKIDLSGHKVTIFGQGNVAIDVARILLSPVDKLAKTDITEHALSALCKSKIQEVHLIGRRGPLQAAYTIKELREMIKLEGCCTHWQPEDFKDLKEIIPTLPRPKKRIMELMMQSLSVNKNGKKIFKPKFFRAPKEIIGNERVKGVKVAVTKLVGSDLLVQSAEVTEEEEHFETDLVVTSIGYKSQQVDENIPFDHDRGVAKNVDGKLAEGLYAAGWLATGPIGVILTTMNNAFYISEVIMKDLESSDLLMGKKEGSREVLRRLEEDNKQIVRWKDWLKIDKYEEGEGRKVGKPRCKVLDLKTMLEIAA